MVRICSYGKSGTVLLICATKKKPADKTGAFDSLEFRGWLSRGHECLAFRIPFANKLLKQFVFFDRSGRFLAGGHCILGGWFYCNSADIFSVLITGLARFQSSSKGARMTNGRRSTQDIDVRFFLAKLALSIRQNPNGDVQLFRVPPETRSAHSGTHMFQTCRAFPGEFLA